MKKQVVMLMLALIPAAGSVPAMAQKNVLSDGGGSTTFGKNALSGGESALTRRNVLNPRSASMEAGNAIPDKRAGLNAVNAIPDKQARLNAGNAIPDKRAGLNASNAMGLADSVLEAYNAIENRDSALTAENALNSEGGQASSRNAFTTRSSQNVLSDSNGIDARREIGAAQVVDSRRKAFRAKTIDEQANAFGSGDGVTVGGISGALELITPGYGSESTTVDQATNVLSRTSSAFSEEFRKRLSERNEHRKDDAWWEAKNAFDGSITETEAVKTGFGKSAF